jgi:hypothetical protein
MRRWTTSRWAQAGISLAAAALVSVCVFVYVNNTHFARYAKEFPHDGQDGLGAMMDAFSEGSSSFFVVFLGLFFLQYLFTTDVGEAK